MKKAIVFFLLSIIFVFTTNAQWQQLNGPFGVDAASIGVSGANIFVGTLGEGLYASYNNGQSWTLANGVPNYVYINAINRTGNHIFAGSYGSFDNGLTWATIGSVYPVCCVMSIDTKDSIVIAGAYCKNSCISIDSGMTWTTATASSFDSYAVAIADSFLLTGPQQDGVLKSTDYGQNWISSNNGLNSLDARYFAICGSNIFVSTFSGRFLSIDDCANWTNVNNGLSSNYAPIVSFGSNVISVSGGKVYISTNLGQNWNSINYNFPPTLIVNALAVDSPYVYVATNMGAWRSKFSDLILHFDSCSSPIINCGDSAHLYAVTTYIGNDSLIFSWSPALGLSSTCSSNPISSTTITTTYYVTVTDGVYTTFDSVLVHVVPITANAGTDKTIFCGDTVQLDSVTSNYNGNGIIKFNWFPSTGLNNDTISNPIANSVINTKYFVTVTAPNGCSVIDSVTVHVIPIIANAGNDDTICAGDTMTLIATGGSTYLWNNGLTQGASFTPSASLIYKVTVTDTNGCSSIDSLTITVNPLPPIPILTQNAYTLISSATSGNQWYNSNSILYGFNSQFYTPISAGDYYVIVTDANGCISDTSNIINVVIAKTQNIFQDDDMNIFPNPTTNNISIETSQKSEIEISNINGQIIKTIILDSGETLINIGDLSNGVYIVKARTDKGIVTKKIIKE